MKRHLSKILLLFVFSQIYAEELPGGHKLTKNDSNEYYVVNDENITMIEASIIKLGIKNNWILACIKHKSIDSDLKRWVFVDLKNGGTYDSINKENWRYFSNEAFPILKEIELKSLNDEDCP